MDGDTLANAALVLGFVLVGGVFAGTEIALVSLRPGQVEQLAQRGGRGARVADVARDPNRFLAAVQIGVTVAGFFSAAFGASTLAPDFVPVLTGLGLDADLADTVALVLLTLVIAYASLVLGELVPKRIALQRAVGVSLLVGPPLDRFAQAVRPVVWLLSRSTDAVVRLVGGDPRAVSEEMDEAELRQLVVGHEELEDDERRILDDVFSAGDRILAEVLTPRPEVESLPLASTVQEALRHALAHPFSRYPVVGEDLDHVRGYVHVRDLVERDPATPLADVVRAVPHVPSTNRVIPTIGALRAQGQHLAVVVDEYGGTAGIVTLEDLVEELVGEIWDEHDRRGREAVEERGGLTTLDARRPVEELGEALGVEVPSGPYETVAGFVVARLERVARVGDVVELDGREVEVVEVDGYRVLRVALRMGEDA